MKILSKEFWMDTLERTIYTAAETAIGVLGGTALISEVDWPLVGSAVALAALTTVLKCILVSVGKGSDDDEI